MKQLALIFLIVLSVSAFGQDKERFDGENELRECEVQVGLYYSTKRNPELMKSVELYKDKQLALLTIDKKKCTTYTYYYLVGDTTSLGPTAYLVEPKFLDADIKERVYLFLDYKPKKHIFYNAECFRNNPVSEKLELKSFDMTDLKRK
ncbi:hypothetical protein LVD15_00250 [Fulvivirga maritima]|uniref:hypothetical protein n=1 Tax=Fulvivirga maritima TaxID=2904247 RepID=UPI001F4634C4|nr:hypothetical protein [Fulvivirga maritima]UII26902.1 hypothetical protein LVD15_00250 [Fulvivirga maritima]